MPPHGLWPIPRHHLYNGTARRKTFNARDFEDDANQGAQMDKGNMPPRSSAESALAQFEAQLEDNTLKTKKERKRDKKEKKKDKKHRRESTDTALETTKASTAAPADAADAVSKPLSSSIPKDGLNIESKSKKGSSARDGPPLSTPTKKRKRKTDTGLVSAGSNNHRGNDTNGGGFVIGTGMVKDLETSMAAIGASFKQDVSEPSRESKKAKKSADKRATVAGLTDDQLKTQQLQSPVLSIKPKSPKKAKKTAPDIDRNTSNSSRSPVKTTTAPLALPSTPPPATRKPQYANNKLSEIIVPETPPSSIPRGSRPYNRTAIPLPSLSASEPHPFKGIQRWVSSQEENGLHDRNETAPKLTQPLSDEPKPKPQPRQRTARASSVSSSVASSQKSVSIIDLFNRAANLQSRPTNAADPFVVASQETNKAARAGKPHEEAKLHDFNDKFNAVVQSMDFNVEQEYLNQHLDWYLEHGTEYEFPCLGRASGCTPKKEETLRQSKSKEGGNTTSIKKAIAASGGDSSTLTEVAQRAAKADNLLKLAIRARVPVPVGVIEGTWTLYCPEYSANHYDRYGYGSRTLTITSIAGFKYKNAYTARLSIPPRSMGYSILAFSVPPHASFRQTVLKTAQEGYTMDAIFLGNGYLQLRVDLNLLLTGKSTEAVGGRKVYMEFVGIHEKAVEWEGGKDDAEEDAKRLFAESDGVDMD
jgi:hypothetical protein